MRTLLILFLGLAFVFAAQDAAGQTNTSVRVRVVSHDAKIIGTAVGGARVIVRDPATGTVLATGIQEGGTGDTRAIVVEPVPRGNTVYDTQGAAQFMVELDLAEPTVLEFVAEGPLGFEQATQRATKTMLIVPGEDVLGNGVLLELHGFIVELLEPAKIAADADRVPVRARVRMMCGCPLEPGGLWDAIRIEVSARLYAAGELVREAVLEYTGEPNIFTGEIAVGSVPEGAVLVVVAADPSRQNFGRSTAMTIP